VLLGLVDYNNWSIEMDGVLLLAIIVAGLALFGAVALVFGTDSRPGFDEGMTVTTLS
jgi:hypothetical protein